MKIFVLLALVFGFVWCPFPISSTPTSRIDLTIDSISILQKRAKLEKDTDTHKAISTIQKAISLAQSIKHDSLILRTKNSYSLYLLMHTDYEKSKDVIKQILPTYEKQGRHFLIGILYNRLGLIESKLDNNKEAYHYLVKALNILPENKIRHHGIAHTYLCELLVKLGNYQDALMHIELSLDLFKQIDNGQYLSMALAALGKLHFKIEDFEQAQSIFQQALQYDVENEQFKINPLVHLGIIEYKFNNPTKAAVHLEKARQLMLKTGNESDLPTVYLYLSQLKKDNEEYLLALILADKSLEIAKEHNLIRQQQLSKLLLSELHSIQGNHDLANTLNTEVLDYATHHVDFELESIASLLMAKAHAQTGDFKCSYEYQIAHQKADKLFHNAKNIIDVTGETTKYRLQKEHSIQKREQAIALKTSKFSRNLFLGFSLLLSVFSFILTQLNKKRKLAIRELEKNNLILLETEEDLDAANQSLIDKNKRLESYINVNLQLENFAHIASHDLKAPLREQASFIQLLEKNTLLTISEKDRKYLSYISRSNSDMQTLIEDMIEYSLLKSDDYKFSWTNPELIVKKAEYLNRDLIYKEGAKVIIHDLPTQIEADPQKIAIVFRNLIHNSLTYTREGIKPIIEIGCEKQKNDYVFYVKDNGLGIHPNFRDDIFDIFKSFSKQINTNGMSHKNGNGLGLAMVKEVIEKHRGRVWLETKTKKGSTFYFSIAA